MRSRYDALGALPEFPWERQWVDRLRTFDDFIELGPLVIESFDWQDTDELRRLHDMAPELWTLLLDAYGTDRQRKRIT